jgi:hypothetical protein
MGISRSHTNLALHGNRDPGRFIRHRRSAICLAVAATLITVCLPALAGWEFNGPPIPNASTQSGDMSLELQCDRIRFGPAGYEDAEDIERSRELSIRFMANGSTETGAFQVGPENADIRIVDGYPVEVVFKSPEDYGFVLDQLGENAILNLSMVDEDISYGIFDLKGSGAAIRSLRSACDKHYPDETSSMEAPEGVVYCGGGAIKRQIEYIILNEPDGEWDARVTVNGETMRAMTSYSYFGNSETPGNFVVALLGEDRSEFLVFSEGKENWLEYGDYTYRQCN